MTSEMRKKLAQESYEEKLAKVAQLIHLIRSVPKFEYPEAPPREIELKEPSPNAWQD